VRKFLQFALDESNIQISVSHTVSAFNIFYLDEFVSWCYNVGLPRPWMGKLHNPEYLRPTVWPKEVKNLIADKLQSSEFEDVKNWAKLVNQVDNYSVFSQFQKFVKQHDQYRKLNFAQVFPEMAHCI
jgi:hypothetical protein